MPRRRWQTGSVMLRGKHVKNVIARFLEDEIDPTKPCTCAFWKEAKKPNKCEQHRRRHRSEILGTLEELPTARLQKRALAERLSKINSSFYQPKYKITITDASAGWLKNVVPQFKPSGQASTRSNMRVITAQFGGLPVHELSLVRLQAWVAGLPVSPKTVTNYISTFQMFWRYARAAGYVSHDPFEFLTLPRAERKEQPSFTPDQVQEIITRADEPFKTMFWILAETGIRGGEVCALYTNDFDFNHGMIYVRRSAFRGKVGTPKTSGSVRAFPISESLARHVQFYTAVLADGGQTTITCPSNLTSTEMDVNPDKVNYKQPYGHPETVQSLAGDERRLLPGDIPASFDSGQGTGVCGVRLPKPPANSLLFKSPTGRPYDNGNVVKRALEPILRAMGIDGPRLALHAMRHMSASAMDAMQVPMQVRMDRLGHGSSRMTMRYTHSNSGDHRRVAEALGRLVSPDPHSLQDTKDSALVNTEPSSNGDRLNPGTVWVGGKTK